VGRTPKRGAAHSFPLGVKVSSLKRGSTGIFAMGVSGASLGIYMTFSEGFSGGAPFFQLATFFLACAWIVERRSRVE
jgi:hypothetical protein